MQNNLERARQFLPFAALVGFNDAIKNVEKQSIMKKDLSVDYIEYLNQKISKLNKGNNVKIKHYYNDEYIETIGIIKKIDINYKTIYLLNTQINFDNILDIDML